MSAIKLCPECNKTEKDCRCYGHYKPITMQQRLKDMGILDVKALTASCIKHGTLHKAPSRPAHWQQP
jgi:hypothetical protein